jgi:excisionase family DNA binding protein
MNRGMDTAKHLDPLELLTIDELAQLSKRSRRSLYYDIANGRLRAVRLGRSMRVPRVEAERFVFGEEPPE